MQASLIQNLAATGASNEIICNGPMSFKLAGTWTGTVALQLKDAAGNFADVADGSYTANVGWTGFDPPPRSVVRFNFTRSTGSVDVTMQQA